MFIWRPCRGRGGGSIMSPIWILKRLVSSLLLRCFVFSHGRGERETSDWWWTAHFHQKRDVWVRGSLVSVFINACAYCRLFRHCHNLAEGGCLLSRFHFMHCRYFLGHVACQNLPWQGLTKCYWVIWFPLKTWQKSSSWSVLY